MKFSKWKQRIWSIKKEALIVYFAYRDPRVPRHVKLFILLLAGYALSPIDLVPDFIPVLGYLDDLIIIPLGIALAMKMIPAPVLEDSKRKAHTFSERKPVLTAGILGSVFWLTVIVFLFWVVLKYAVQ